jgi:hypothetical protein
MDNYRQLDQIETSECFKLYKKKAFCFNDFVSARNLNSSQNRGAIIMVSRVAAVEKAKRSFHLFVFHLLLVFGGGVLVLLVLRDEIVHVGLGFSEFHLVHTFTGVPMEEGLSAEHGGELLSDTFEHLLDGGGVSEESDGHLESLGGDIANGRFDVVGNPLNEVRGVLVLNVEHLLVNLLGGHTSSEEGGGGEVTSVSGVGSAHHVLGVEHLLGELGDGEGTVLLRSSGGEGGESNHEEMESGEGDQVDGDFTEIGVKLSGES